MKHTYHVEFKEGEHWLPTEHFHLSRKFADEAAEIVKMMKGAPVRVIELQVDQWRDNLSQAGLRYEPCCGKPERGVNE
jgi:hypothetical protein